ncbi:MAG: ATP-binding protein, partial [Luteimonas sp.]
HRQRIEQPETLQLDAVVRDAAQQVAGKLAKAAVGLHVTAADPSAHVSGDPFLLRQALTNLLDNAIDFAPRGSRIEIDLARVGDVLRIAISDRGPGTPDYATDRVFERFYSLPRPDGGSRSSGLGLCFVAQVAGLHGGRATLENRDGGGTIATIDLPLL